MPNRKQIHKRAIEIYMGEQARINFALGSNTPELGELKEGGYWQRAKEDLRASKMPDVIIIRQPAQGTVTKQLHV